ncbi:MAG TPA: PSD1 and planctomycete cytochrome C domain-containing protein [Bryobacteraceae bacterium]|nr:PSD1 and planctomycete cytochrome C domain-containing protein [Bryobacteraceae bacterium]
MGEKLTCILILAAVSPAYAEVRFNRDVRPIMAETCFRCHGPDKSSRMAGMRLDLRDEALKRLPDGQTPIVPGDPEKSAIIQRVFAADGRVMPPAYIHKDLTPAQKQTIRQWVAEGAKYEGHWAYQPVQRQTPPNPNLNPIDAFIQERLTREGLHPSPEADRRTLIRRVTLDLTGLPPKPQDTAAFLKDTSPNAYEKVVDRLLASPAYAEQQSMHWLDAVRYADTCGFHGDNAFPAWPYRDYVLRAFRDNKPFDQFTREQLAGDLIPNPTIEQRVASAYNRLNRTSAEGGLQPKEYLAKYAADRVRTAAAVWMGSTVGCAECHDHKFDPFLSRDFYSMKAFFADIKETGLMPDRGKNAWGSQIDLPSPEQQKQREDLKAKLADAQARLAAKMQTLEPRRAEWEKQFLARYEAGQLAWHTQRPLSAQSTNGAVLKIYNEEEIDYTTYDGSNLTAYRAPGNGLVVASGPNPDNETYTVTFKPGAGTWTALGVEVVQDDSLPGLRVARGADRMVLTEVEAEADGKKLNFSIGTSNLNMTAPQHPAAAAFDGDPNTGWAVATYNEYSKIVLALRFTQPLQTEAATTVTVRLHQDSTYRRATMGRFRLQLSSGDYPWPTSEKGKEIPDAVLKAMRIAEDKRTPEQKTSVANHFQWASHETEPEAIEVAKVDKDLALLEAAIPRVVVSEATTPTETRILARGNWMDESGEVVQPAIPAFLGKLDTGGARATRLDLANWLVSAQNPLTARVFANRMWREFFGIGITKALDDMGSQGEWPTNPELLDWLAAEFMKPEWQAEGTHPWDVKHLIRTIVTSAAYRQSSMASPELQERDPDNRLVARQTRFRVDAEVVRDISLSVSGLLVDRFGGPSAKPYEPDGYLATLNFPRREYSASHGDDLYRRGVYTFWQRSFLHPSLVTFDAPTREECTINRTTSNTPLQALVLLNDPTYVEASRVFAQNILKHAHNWNDRVDWAFQRAVDRAPTAEERRILSDLYRKTFEQFQHSPAEAAALIHEGEAPVAADLKPTELAAMTTVARAILNMHETITRN